MLTSNRIFAIIQLLILSSFMGCDQSYNVVLISDNAAGLSEDTKVKVHGVEVGTLESVDLTQDLKVAAKLKVENDVRIPKDSKFSIHSEGFFGEMAIRVTGGKTDKMLQAGDTVRLDLMPSIRQDSSIERKLSTLIETFVHSLQKDSIFNELKLIQGRLDSLERVR